MWTMSQIAKDQSGPERTYLSGGQRTDQTENIFKKSFQNPKKKRTMIKLRKMLVPNTPITEKVQQSTIFSRNISLVVLYQFRFVTAIKIENQTIL